MTLPLLLLGNPIYAKKLMVEDLLNKDYMIPLANEHEPLKEQLRQVLIKYLRGKFRIQEELYCLNKLPVSWVTIDQLFSNTLVNQGYRVRQVKLLWHNPGYDSFTILQLGRGSHQYAAVGMSDERVDGKSLIGYFILEKSTKEKLAIEPLKSP